MATEGQKFYNNIYFGPQNVDNGEPFARLMVGFSTVGTEAQRKQQLQWWADALEIEAKRLRENPPPCLFD